MRKDASAPVCVTGIHVARYRWANKETAVVTNPDASILDKHSPAKPGQPKDGVSGPYFALVESN
jgi:hypothetical protein